VNRGATPDESSVPPSEPPPRRVGRRRLFAIVGVAGAIFVVLIVLFVVLPLGKSFEVTAVNVSYTGSGAEGVCTLSPNYTHACEPNGYNVCLEQLGPCPSNLAAGQSAEAAFNTELQNVSECGSVYEVTQVTTPSSIFHIRNVTNLGNGPPFLLGHTPVPNDPVYCTMTLEVIVDYTVSNGSAVSAPLDLIVTVVLE
jgi:hypothetical protein